MNVLCDEVWVSFVSPNMHGQRIRAQEVNGANRLRVIVDDFADFLYVVYGHEAKGEFKAVKSLAFNREQVKEFSAEGRLEEALIEKLDEQSKD